MTQVTKLKVTYWNVREIGGVDPRNRIRRQYVLDEIFSGDWDVIGLISVHRAALSFVDTEASEHGYDVVASTAEFSSDRADARTRHTMMLVRSGLRVLKYRSTLQFAEVLKRRDGVAGFCEGLVLSAAGVILDVDPEPLAVVAVYTPQHERIDYRSPDAMSTKTSGPGGKRCIYTPQQLSESKHETASDLAVWWANTFAGEGSPSVVGGDWNLMSDPSDANQDWSVKICKAGRDESGRGWVQLLQSSRSPIHPTFPYPARENRNGRFIDQVFARFAQDTSAELKVVPPPWIVHHGEDLGYASDHARLCVTLGNSRHFRK